MKGEKTIDEEIKERLKEIREDNPENIKEVFTQEEHISEFLEFLLKREYDIRIEHEDFGRLRGIFFIFLGREPGEKK